MKLLYFAWVRERIGKSEETIDPPTGIKNISGLVNFLETLDEGYIQAFQTRKKVNVAVNQNHADWDQSINKEDEIAFFPPVTGG